MPILIFFHSLLLSFTRFSFYLHFVVVVVIVIIVCIITIKLIKNVVFFLTFHTMRFRDHVRLFPVKF